MTSEVKSFRPTLAIIFLVVAIAFVAWSSALKIVDLDFWWHITAGKIMVQTHQLISVEPFAWTRAGLPYLPRYEYLAQIVLYELWHWGGANAVIIFRMAMAVGALVTLLFIDRKSIWPNALLVLWVADVNRQAFLERPQLFSYVFFALWLWLCYWYLEVSDQPPGKARHSLQMKLLVVLVVVQIAWANFHGGANIVAVAVFGALVAEQAWQWWRHKTDVGKKEVLTLCVTLVGLVVAIMMTPNLLGNYSYVLSLLHEQSNTMIKEWQPRPWPIYLTELGPFWLMALLALGYRRKHWVFSGLLLFITGYMSIKAYRHGTFFFAAALAVIFYQLRHTPGWQKWLDYVARFKVAAVVISLLVVGGVTAAVYRWHIHELMLNDLYGFGTSVHGQGACDFLDKEKIQGRMYNSYNIGGYLIYCGYPNRLVFSDGRNVDYGTVFVQKAILAGYNPDIWAELDKQYNFDYAVIDFLGLDDHNRPYMAHLNSNPNWQLVYFDDVTAVYVKKNAQNAAVIAKDGYQYINPANVRDGTVFANAGDHAADVEKELQRMIASTPYNQAASVILGMHDLDTGKTAEGRAIGQALLKAHPERAEAYEIVGMSYMADHEWALAALNLEESLHHASLTAMGVNYELLAEAFSKAGDSAKALHYHNLFLRHPLPK